MSCIIMYIEVVIVDAGAIVLSSSAAIYSFIDHDTELADNYNYDSLTSSAVSCR